jgi:hypothetical protein
MYEHSHNLKDNGSDLQYKGKSLALTALLGASAFISPDGDDDSAKPGRIDRPYKTLQRIFDDGATANTCVRAGNNVPSIVVLPGIYNQATSTLITSGEGKLNNQTLQYGVHICFINARWVGDISILNLQPSPNRTGPSGNDAVGCILDGGYASQIIGKVRLTSAAGGFVNLVRGFWNISEISVTGNVRVEDIVYGFSCNTIGGGWDVFRSKVTAMPLSAYDARWTWRNVVSFTDCDISIPVACRIDEHTLPYQLPVYFTRCKVVSANTDYLITNYYPPFVRFLDCEISLASVLAPGGGLYLELQGCRITTTAAGATLFTQQLNSLKAFFNVSNKDFFASNQEPVIWQGDFNTVY